MNRVLKITFLFALTFSFALSAQAQIPGSIDGVEIGISPNYPSAGQNISVSIESYNTNLNAASIVWVVDGKTVAQGTGVTSVQVIAPEIGKSMIVTARILTAEGKEVAKTVTIKPGDVDLVWESTGYVPPLYKGKALFAYQNLVNITAIPHLGTAGGKEMDPKTLVYKWTVNDKVVQNQSGYGKQTLSIEEELPKSLRIEVIVSNRDGSTQGSATMSLEPGNPSIILYEEDLLYGVFYNKALESRFGISKDEVSLLAVPYFFSSVGTNSRLTYTWSINDLEQPNISKNQSITLRTKEDAEGSSLLSLDIRNRDQILQGAKRAITLFFNKRPAEQQQQVIF